MIFWHREPWIIHLNLLLCQSHTPLSISFLSSCPPHTPPPSSLPHPPPPFPLPIFTIHPHQSSASFLLSSPRPPSLLPSFLILPLHQTVDRKRYRIRLEQTELNTYCISVYYPGLAQVAALIHLHNHAIGIGTLARYFCKSSMQIWTRSKDKTTN